MDEITLLRIDSVLKHIDEVLNDTNGVTLDELKKSNLLLRATCFSVAQIGETMNQSLSIGTKLTNNNYPVSCPFLMDNYSYFCLESRRHPHGLNISNHFVAQQISQRVPRGEEHDRPSQRERLPGNSRERTL